MDENHPLNRVLIPRKITEEGWFVTSPFRSPVVGSHPIGIEGYKTLAYEMVDQLDGAVPDWCVAPVCYGDALAGMWEGFKELLNAGVISKTPRLVAAEVHGSLGKALREGKDTIPEMPAEFETLAVSIGTCQSTYQALAALRESDGIAVEVGNMGLLEMQRQIASLSGLLPELAAVTPFVAIRDLTQRGIIARQDIVIALMTASGLKDIDAGGVDDGPPPFTSLMEAWSMATSDLGD